MMNLNQSFQRKLFLVIQFKSKPCEWISKLFLNVNPLPLPDSIEIDSLRGKMFFEHALPSRLNLNHNTCSFFSHIHVKCESMSHGTKVHFNLAIA